MLLCIEQENLDQGVAERQFQLAAYLFGKRIQVREYRIVLIEIFEVVVEDIVAAANIVLAGRCGGRGSRNKILAFERGNDRLGLRLVVGVKKLAADRQDQESN